MFPGTRDRVPSFIEKLFDAKHLLNVLPFVNAMARFRLFGGKIRKFGLPKPENERLNINDLADLAYAEEELVWNVGCPHKREWEK